MRHPPAHNMRGLRVFRYVVTETWGDVPPDVLKLVSTPDAYCIDTYRGQETQWELERDGEIIGGWAGVYAGISPPAVEKHNGAAHDAEGQP